MILLMLAGFDIPVILASNSGHYDDLQSICQDGVDVDAVDNHQQTPLMFGGQA